MDSWLSSRSFPTDPFLLPSWAQNQLSSRLPGASPRSGGAAGAEEESHGGEIAPHDFERWTRGDSEGSGSQQKTSVEDPVSFQLAWDQLVESSSRLWLGEASSTVRREVSEKVNTRTESEGKKEHFEEDLPSEAPKHMKLLTDLPELPVLSAKELAYEIETLSARADADGSHLAEHDVLMWVACQKSMELCGEINQDFVTGELMILEHVLSR